MITSGCFCMFLKIIKVYVQIILRIIKVWELGMETRRKLRVPSICSSAVTVLATSFFSQQKVMLTLLSPS